MRPSLFLSSKTIKFVVSHLLNHPGTSAYSALLTVLIRLVRANAATAGAGMVAGFLFTATYIAYFKFINPEANFAANWLFGISPEGIGTLGTILNLVIAYTVCQFTAEPPQEVQDIVEHIRLPGEINAN